MNNVIRFEDLEKISQLRKKIKRVQLELQLIADDHNQLLTDPAVVDKSQELDLLIVQIMELLHLGSESYKRCI